MLSDFQRLFDGFEHGGLRLSVDLDRSSAPGNAICVISDVETGEPVGEFWRWLEERDGVLRMKVDHQYLAERYRRRGFSRALQAHAEPRYRDLGIQAVVMRARDEGAAVWHKFGYDFDLSRVEGADEARRRARAVALIFAPDAHRRLRSKVLPPPWRRLPNPHLVLRAAGRRPGRRGRAAREMRGRIPDERRVESGELEGTFRTPGEITEFEAHGVALGSEVMRFAEWDGIRYLE